MHRRELGQDASAVEPSRREVSSSPEGTDRRRFLKTGAAASAGATVAYALPQVASAAAAQELSPLTCSVVASGPHCLCKGMVETYSASADPGGGTFSWKISAGDAMASIVGGADAATVMVRGDNPSAAVDDVTLEVTYTILGTTCTDTRKLTVIKADLTFLAAGMWDPKNGVERNPARGHPMLGPVTPGNPPGTTGYLKNIQIEGKITPCVAGLPCTFDFKREKSGRSGILPAGGGAFVPDGFDCPGPMFCDDDMVNTDEDLVPDPPPDCTIYVIDNPGVTMPGSCAAGNVGEICIISLNFREWLNADGKRCTNDLNWHASTRIECTAGGWVLNNGGSGNVVGSGHIDIALKEALVAELSLEPFSAELALELLTSPSTADRLRGQNAILAAFRSGALSPSERETVVPALVDLASQQEPCYPIWSTPMLALRLLGVLGAEEGIPILLDRSSEEFPRPIVTNRDRSLTVAADALGRIGTDAVPAILDRASGASDEEWKMLRRSLQVIRDRAGVEKAMRLRLESEGDPQVRQRLQGWLATQRR